MSPLAEHAQGLRLEVGEAENEVGLERFNGLITDGGEGGDDRLPARLARDGRLA